MSRIIKTLTFFSILLLLSGCADNEITKPSKLECPLEVEATYKVNPKSNYYQLIIDKYVQNGLPGVALLIWDNQGFYIGSAGRSDIAKNVLLQPCHIAKVASITKIMLGVTIMRLQEKGVLSLNDPIANYIPDDILNKINNGKEPLTIRNLMNHTSGFYDVIEDQGFYLQVLNDPAKKWTSDELLEYVYNKDAQFDFRPEDTAAYSNTNYLLLGMIIDAATGAHHSKALRDEIIEPLGMSDTYYYWHDQLPDNKIAQGYFDLYNNGNIENLTNWNTGSGNGYTGVYSTVWDMYLFTKALYVDKILLSQSSLDEMLVFHPDIETRKHLGVACIKDFIDIGNPDTDYAWGHRGRDLAYSADLFYFPHHNTIMTMICNYGTDGESNLRPTFLQMRDEIARKIIEP